MESALCCIQMEEYLKGTGKITLSMAKDTRNSTMGQSTTAPTQMENLKDMGPTHGTMARRMKANGLMGKNMDLESGEVHKVTHILVSGNKIKHSAMECILGLTAIDTKENFRIA